MIPHQIKYEIQLYLKGHSFVMPSILIIFFLFTAYSVKPYDVMSGYLITCVFVFLIMDWIGMTEAQRENPVMEQLLLLKGGNPTQYYISKFLFLFLLSLIVSVICAAFPSFENWISGGDLFTRPLLLQDIVNAFILLVGCGICGASIGSFLHPRVLRDRKQAIALTVLITILMISRYGIVERVPILKYLMWILPPVMLPQKMFGNEEYFRIDQSIWIFLLLLIYAIVYFAIKSYICQRRKF